MVLLFHVLRVLREVKSKNISSERLESGKPRDGLDMSDEKRSPPDILEVFQMMRWMHSDLSDVMDFQVQEWMDALREEVKDWKKNGGKEPNWDGFRLEMNEFCKEEGMPLLFEINPDVREC